MTLYVDHPDEALVAHVVADLTAWLNIPGRDATSAVTGGGAVRTAEERFAALHGGRPALLLPSATYGMYAALLAVGVEPGDLVLVPAVDWTATVSAVCAVGAEPVTVPVDPATGTLHPAGVASALAALGAPGRDAIGAIVACHLHGVPVDVPGIRAVAGPRTPVLEDCAQALGSAWDGRPVGTFGDVAIFGFGPAKAIDVGEAGMVTSARPDLHARLIELTAHPVRQVLSGLDCPGTGGLSMRVTQVSAIQLAVALAQWRPAVARARQAWLRERLMAAAPSTAVLGADPRRGNAAPSVPVGGLLTIGPDAALVGVPSGALDIREWIAGRMKHADVMLVRSRGAVFTKR